jgi:hypothetical protein
MVNSLQINSSIIAINKEHLGISSKNNLSFGAGSKLFNSTKTHIFSGNKNKFMSYGPKRKE